MIKFKRTILIFTVLLGSLHATTDLSLSQLRKRSHTASLLSSSSSTLEHDEYPQESSENSQYYHTSPVLRSNNNNNNQNNIGDSSHSIVMNDPSPRKLGDETLEANTQIALVERYEDPAEERDVDGDNLFDFFETRSGQNVLVEEIDVEAEAKQEEVEVPNHHFGN